MGRDGVDAEGEGRLGVGHDGFVDRGLVSLHDLRAMINNLETCEILPVSALKPLLPLSDNNNRGLLYIHVTR